MPSSKWSHITGPDLDKRTPIQQTSALSLLSNQNIIFPYGYYANLPDNTRLYEIDGKAAISMTDTRPTDLARGEPTFFHPSTNTRIIARNNGDLDIIADDGSSTGNLNINCVNANITCTEDINVDCKKAIVTAATSTEIKSPTIALKGVTGNTIVSITGDLNVSGDTALSSNVTSGGTNISNTHRHDGSPTAPTGIISNTGTSI